MWEASQRASEGAAMSTLTEAYYRVGNHLREQAGRLSDAAEMLFAMADQMSEQEMREKSPPPPDTRG